MLSSLAIAYALATPPCADTDQAPVQREWSVEKVYAPPTWTPGIASVWREARAQRPMIPGEPTGGFLLHALDLTGFSAAIDQLAYQPGAGYGRAIHASAGTGGGYSYQTVLLKVPGGRRIATTDHLNPGFISVYSIPAGAPLATIGPIFLAGGVQVVPVHAFPAGDIDGDQFDDFFVTLSGSSTLGGTYDGVGLFSGRTLQFLWTHVEPGHENWAVSQANPSRLPDFDLDGTADHVMSSAWLNPSTLNFETRIVSLHGATGTEIWRRLLPGLAHGPHLTIPDATGDGRDDVLTFTNNPLVTLTTEVFLLSGFDGSVHWQIPLSSISTLGATGPVFSYRAWVASYHPVGSSGSGEIVLTLERTYVSGAREWVHVNLDPATGVATGYGFDPTYLEPWSSVPLMTTTVGNTGHFSVGDYDRDGLQEIAVPATAPGWPTAGWQASRYMVIIGESTLHCASQTQIGSVLQVDIDIPSAGNLDCVLLASTGFDSAGGLMLDGWETNLALGNSALQYTMQGFPFSTTLDSSGSGTMSVPIPALPQLVGKSLFLRAIALEQGSSTDVWTISSLAQTELLP